MRSYSGKEFQVNAPVEKIYNFLTDFRNFKDFLPEQITQWESDGEHCRFHLPNVGMMELEYREKKQNDLVRVGIPEKSNIPVHFVLNIFLRKEDQQRTNVQFVLDLDSNVVLENLMNPYLQHLVEMLSQRFQQIFEMT